MLSSLKLIPSKYGQWRESKKGDLLPMNTPENKSRSVAQILEKFGLSWRRTTKGKGEHCYKITDESISTMKEYAERRYRVSQPLTIYLSTKRKLPKVDNLTS